MQPFEKSFVMFLLKHLIGGASGGIALGTGLFVLDVASLRTLVGQSEDGLIAAFLLFFGLILTFGSVAVGVGVMTMNGFIERD